MAQHAAHAVPGTDLITHFASCSQPYPTRKWLPVASRSFLSPIGIRAARSHSRQSGFQHAKSVLLHDDVAVLHCAGAEATLKGRWRLESEGDEALLEGVPTYRMRYRASPVPGVTYLIYLETSGAFRASSARDSPRHYSCPCLRRRGACGDDRQVQSDSRRSGRALFVISQKVAQAPRPRQAGRHSGARIGSFQSVAPCKMRLNGIGWAGASKSYPMLPTPACFSLRRMFEATLRQRESYL